ncbi:DUF4157 domain-containing protein [Streptomyces sp. NPDC052042]|uniref:DUF4157 domain-containing protein n=1 Tax=Streptomyces sp. NPDC052042 TaxID=3365683 RepID=UPI0037D172C6
MRDRDGAYTTEARDGRDTARIVASDRSPQGLLALQATVGNAAVVQLLRAAGHPGARPQVQRSAVHDILHAPGRPLDDSTRADMEARFDADFSDVRIHDDTAARASAAGIGARAYTSGSHVVIGDGGADRHTLAHELTHVIQQRSGPVAGTDRGNGLRVSDPGDRFEREAEQHATRVLGSSPAAHVAHTPAEHTGHTHTGHAARPGSAVQRVVYGTNKEQKDQREQLENLPAMWVPVEEFDEDGNPRPRPTVAYTGQRDGYGMDALRVERTFALPSRTATRSGILLVDNWEIEYQTSFFVYKVQAINDRHRQHSRILINPDQPFAVVGRVAKGSQGRSMGRPYRFGDYWDVNPDFRGGPDSSVDHDMDMEELIARRGLKEDNRVRSADRDSLVQLPSDPYQPFLFYTRDITDPNFTHPGGARKDDRRFLLPADFDHLAGQARAAGKTRDQVGLSKQPVAGRQDAGRDPSKGMGGFRAHAIMPVSGHGATGGRLAHLASHEWCHLIGDNDGGPAIFHNLVVGTNAVNTEQLAMESALRDFRPRMDGLGCAIRLRVEAIVEEAELEEPGIPGGSYHKADWISFTIDIVDKDPSAGAVETRPSVGEVVHRQIMDANRGTITESEFNSLHHQVRNLLHAEHLRLKEKQRAEPAWQGSPMSID